MAASRHLAAIPECEELDLQGTGASSAVTPFVPVLDTSELESKKATVLGMVAQMRE